MVVDKRILPFIEQALDKSLLHIECEDIQGDSLLILLKEKYSSIGVVCREEYFYNRLTVGEMVELFSELAGKRGRKYEAIQLMQLQNELSIKGEQMSHSLKKRLAIAREIIFDRQLIVIQEPILNLDELSRRIVLEWLTNLNKTCITMTHSLKHALLLNGSVYSIIQDELIEQHFEEAVEVDEISTVQIKKITGKIENRTFLFDPFEIDYIESNTGSNYLKVKGEEFLSTLSMDELEQQLKPFGFFRSHRSYLVNLQRVSEFEKWSKNSYILKLNDKEGSVIPLSKGRVEALKEVYFIQ